MEVLSRLYLGSVIAIIDSDGALRILSCYGHKVSRFYVQTTCQRDIVAVHCMLPRHFFLA